MEIKETRGNTDKMLKNKLTNLMVALTVLFATYSFPIIKEGDTIVDVSKAIAVYLSNDPLANKKITVEFETGNYVNIDFESRDKAKDFFDAYYYWKLKEAKVVDL